VQRTPDAVVYRELDAPRADALPAVARLASGYGAMGSFARTRRVEVLVDGRPRPALTVPLGLAEFGIDLGRVGPGRHTVRLRPRPGPEVIGNGDPRTVSLRVLEPFVVEFGP
jgi:hypothetical protein